MSEQQPHIPDLPVPDPAELSEAARELIRPSRPNNIFDLLTTRSQSEQGADPAIHWEGRTLSWEAVERAAREVAGGLVSMGVRPGDRIAAVLPNVPPYLFLQYATHLLGAIFVPIHEMTRSTELSYILEDCEAKLLFAWGDEIEPIRQAADSIETLGEVVEIGSSRSDVHEVISWLEQCDPVTGEPVGGGSDCALIRYTAGVTGRPKGAMISHENVLFAARETDAALRILSKDRVLGLMPFHHPFGSTMELQLTLATGASLAMQTSFDPAAALELIRQREVSVLIGLPMHFAALVDEAGSEAELGKLRFAVCGGGPLEMVVLTRFERAYATRIATVYGTCETSPTIAINPAHREETPRDSLGRSLSGTEIEIVDEQDQPLPLGEVGEIVVRSPGVFIGYWNRPEATRKVVDEQQRFHTTDLGSMDIDGWLYGAGRMHDRINRGGFSVYPREVEQVLNAHPSVHESAVIGVPDKKMGQQIVAYVVTRPGLEIRQRELVDYCSEQLARFKAPSQVHVVASLPRSASGVVLRRELRERGQQDGSGPH